MPTHAEVLAELVAAYERLLERGWKRNGLTQRRIDAIRWALAQLPSQP